MGGSDVGCLGEAKKVGWIRGWVPIGGSLGWVHPMSGADGRHVGLGASEVACLLAVGALKMPSDGEAREHIDVGHWTV